jgi:two-component system, chemotaxis family, chemotaxis protein CheY
MAPAPHRTVLVVDDNVDARDLVETLLVLDGFAVLVAGNGQEALDRLATDADRPACIVLDLTMPVMDGWTFLRRLLAIDALADIPVIVCTASTLPPPSAATVVVYKPADPNKLLNLVRRYSSLERAPASPPAL